MESGELKLVKKNFIFEINAQNKRKPQNYKSSINVTHKLDIPPRHSLKGS